MDEELNSFALAAERAKADLESKMQDPEFKKAVSIVAKWWKSWYMSTGHRHLGKILVAIAKEYL